MATPRPARRPRKEPVDPDPRFHPPGPVVEPAAPRKETAEVAAGRPGPFPKASVAWLVLLGTLAYAVGWYISFTGAALFPGFFLASDFALATVSILLLRTLARVTGRRIRDPALGVPSAAVPKAGAWALGVFWAFFMFTQVEQLAVGLGVGIVAYQLYATKTRLERAGYVHATRFGPAFRPTLIILGSYAAWVVVRRLAGSLPGFDLITVVALVALVVLTLRLTDRSARSLAGTSQRRAAVKADGGTRRDLERRVIAGVIVGYLFFRFFVSSAIPYGPIVEWFLVCVGALFVAIVMADRIGVVPTRRSLPHPDLRVHVQRIVSLPDRDLEESNEHIAAFITQGRDPKWIHDRFDALLESVDMDPAERRHHLTPLRPQGKRGHAPAEASGLEARERLVRGLLLLLQERRHRGATGTLKTDANVRKDGKAPRSLVVPTP